MNQEARFSRMEPELRKANLIEATLVCLKRHGFQGASIRKISAEAGVSVGLISHHYSGKDELVAEAYMAITGRVMTLLRDAMEQAAPNARERLSAFFRGSFSAELLDPQLIDAWLAFWGAVKTAEAINQAHDHSYGEYRAILRKVLRELAQEEGWENFDADLAAISLSALARWPVAGVRTEPRDLYPGAGHADLRGLGRRFAGRWPPAFLRCRRAAVDRPFSTGYSLPLMQQNTLIRKRLRAQAGHPAMTPRVLIVDDDPLIRELLHAYLSQEGYDVHCAATAELAETFLASQAVDLVMLDIRLPGKDGLTLTRELRVRSEVGIILITGRNDEIDRIVGLECGADDYVIKPLNPRELVSRAKNLIRRVRHAQTPQPVAAVAKPVKQFADWALDTDRRRLIDPVRQRDVADPRRIPVAQRVPAQQRPYPEPRPVDGPDPQPRMGAQRPFDRRAGRALAPQVARRSRPNRS